MKQSSTRSFFAVLIGAGTLLFSCDTKELKTKATQAGTAFYTAVQHKDYTAALAQCSPKAFKTDDKEKWMAAFSRNEGLLGELKSFTPVSEATVNRGTDKGTTVTTLYDVQWEFGKTKDSVIVVKEDDGALKVMRYAWDATGSKYLTETTQSEEQATQYMNAVKAKDYTTAIGFCSQEALAITPKEQWATVLETASSHWGNVASFNVVKDSTTYHIGSTGGLGKGNYYDVVVQTARGENKVMEKMIFFQKTFNEPLKLTGHLFL